MINSLADFGTDGRKSIGVSNNIKNGFVLFKCPTKF